MTLKNIKINAFDIGISDLDEHLPCQKIKKEVEKYNGEKEIDSIEINLEKCWLDYSFSYLYLDEALRILINSITKNQKTLKIIVSVDLGEPHFMAALLFPLSTIIKANAEDGPLGLLTEVKKVCHENNLNITIVSRLAGNPAHQNERQFNLGASTSGAINE